MFNDINEVRLMGNVTNDPDLRFTPAGTAVLSFGLATNRRYKKGDEWTDEPTFHNIVIWGNYAQSLAPRIHKGTRMVVNGRIQTRSWDGQDGKKNYKTEIVSNEVNLVSRYNEGKLDSAQAPSGGGNYSPSADNSGSTPSSSNEDESIDPDDLPF